MSYNVLELPQGGQNLTSAAGENTLTLQTNPGPDIRVYLYCDMRITDVTDRICGIYLIPNASGQLILITDNKTIANNAGGTERVNLIRPIIVLPGESLRCDAEAMSTVGTITSRSTFVTVPLGQTLNLAF